MWNFIQFKVLQFVWKRIYSYLWGNKFKNNFRRYCQKKCVCVYVIFSDNEFKQIFTAWMSETYILTMFSLHSLVDYQTYNVLCSQKPKWNSIFEMVGNAVVSLSDRWSSWNMCGGRLYLQCPKKEKNIDMEINASDLVNPWCLLCTGVSDLVLAGMEILNNATFQERQAKDTL